MSIVLNRSRTMAIAKYHSHNVFLLPTFPPYYQIHRQALEPFHFPNWESKNLFLHENNEWVNNENQKTQPQKE